jgi:hypothetical protein
MWRRLLYLFPVLLIFATIGMGFVHQLPASAASPTAQQAFDACNNAGIDPNAGNGGCPLGYIAGYNGSPEPKGSSGFFDSGYKLGVQARGGKPTNGNTKPPANVSKSIQQKAFNYCNNSFSGDVGNCSAGYEWGYTGGTKPTPCNSFCGGGYAQGVTDIGQDKANAPAGCPSNPTPSELQACQAGADGVKNNKTESQTCQSYTGSQLAACKATWEQATAAAAGTANKQLGCDAKFSNPLTWIICPVVDVLTSIINTIDNIITDQLNVKTDAIFCDTSQTCQAYYSAWQAFRDIALGLMAIAGLVMVIAQALGMEILDAYTLRKVLPRLLIAAIAISLSWPLMRFLIQLSDDLGFGVRSLIYAPFSHLSDTLNLDFSGSAASTFFGGLGLAGATAVAAPVVVILAGGLGALLAYAVTAALAVFVAVLVLILRQVVIIMLMLLAPIAIVAYILPNTNRLFRLWWDNFSKALLMFPLIAAFIATGRIFSAIAIHNGGAINQLIGFIAYFAPYFLIPLTFRMAGGAVGGLGNFVNQRSQNGFEGLRKFRAARRAGGRQRLQTGQLFRDPPEGSRRQRYGRAVQLASLANPDEMGLNPRTMLRNARALRERSDIARAQKYNESEAFQPIVGDDDAHKAILHGDMTMESAREYLNGLSHLTAEERERKLGHIEMARKEMGQKALGAAAIIAQSGTSTGYQGGIGEMLSDIDRVGGNDDNLRNTIIGATKRTAEGAGRGDLSASFGDAVVQSRLIANAQGDVARQAAIDNAGVQLGQNIVRTKSAGYILSQKGIAIEHLMPAMRGRIEESMATLADVASGDPARAHTVVDRNTGQQRPMTVAEANREVKQVLASTSAFHDVAAQVSPEAGQLVADGLLNGTLTDVRSDGTAGATVTIQQAIEANRGDAEFQQMHKEYTQTTERQVASAQAAQQAAGGQPGGQPGGTAGP